MLPVFLTGGLAVQIRAELGFGIGALGLAASLFFGTSALTSVLMGRVVQRIGARRGMRLAALAGATSLAGVGLIADSWAQLAAFLMIGGVANATGNPATHLLLAAAIARWRQGLAFGIKQAAIPTATFLSGLAAPLVALTAGWRVAFVAAAAAATVIAVIAPREPEQRGHEGDPERPGADRAPPAALLALTLGVGLGSAAAVPLGSFLVESAVAVGLGEAAAGTLLAVVSAVSVAARLALGRRADTREGGHLRTVATLLIGGVAGFALLAAAGSPGPLVAGALLAFASGWAWPGLFNFAVINENRAAPATATGVTLTGAYLGSALGPLAFGLVAQELSYGVAWLGSAAFALASAAAVLTARRLVIGARAAAAAAR